MLGGITGHSSLHNNDGSTLFRIELPEPYCQEKGHFQTADV